jgi:formamidopyrimidine-DNA glycosylase
MPELPEVETIANGLNRRVAGDHIDSVWLGNKPEPLKSPAREIVKTLEGTRIEKVRRVGKHIVFDLAGDKPAQWIVHLGMSGRLLVNEPDAEIQKHTHAIVKLSSGREIRFVDPRRFGRLAVVGPTKTGKSQAGFAGPGSEPLGIDFDHFVSLFRKRKTAIKAALLNQKLLHGVGNIYADESLFRAGIRPRRRAGQLTRNELKRLHSAVQTVLQEAIALGGSSVSDYVDSDGAEGFFQLKHQVYGRTNARCYICKTPIKRIVVAGRGTHYCPKCQKLGLGPRAAREPCGTGLGWRRPSGLQERFLNQPRL